jgi:UDP-N-acetylmuramoyl-tripeptide--D-alanyl-D-alanine ligase
MKIEDLYNIYQKCHSVTTDSRNCPENSLFFALKGESFNGNLFAKQALESGCSFAVIDEPGFKADERYIVVDDCLNTLQDLARYHRLKSGIPVIGITGTNGKTTTKELMASVLNKKFNTLYTQGNLNNHIGVPLTLLRLKKEHSLAIIEMGANHPGEIRDLVKIADPDLGLITNVGKAHLEGFGSFEGVIKTKGELYDYLREKGGKIFINMENPYLRSIAKGINQIPYATKEGYPVFGEIISCSPFMNFKWYSDFGKKSYTAKTNLIGSYNLENALAAVCVGLHFGISPDKICEALQEYTPSNNRSQLMKTEQNTLIIDAYNANPTSMAAALKNFSQYEAPKKAAILGSMKELGELSDEEHKILTFNIAEQNFDRVFLIGKEFKKTNTDYPVYEDADTFIEYLKVQPLEGYTVLIKGSRGNQLESIVPYL